MNRPARGHMADFEYFKTLVQITGERAPGYRIHCERCGETSVLTLSGSTCASQQWVERRFRAEGWEVSTSRRADHCPACVALIQAERRAKRGARILELKQDIGLAVAPITIEGEVMTEVKAPAPRAMTLADRRRINERLSEVYLENAYAAGFSDNRVAVDLNVPRAWVTEIRDLLYGPAVNEDTLAARAEIKALTERATKIEAAIEGLIDELGRIKEGLKAALKKVGT